MCLFPFGRVWVSSSFLSGAGVGCNEWDWCGWCGAEDRCRTYDGIVCFCVRMEVLCASDVVLVSVPVLHCDQFGAVGVHISYYTAACVKFLFGSVDWDRAELSED